MAVRVLSGKELTDFLTRHPYDPTDIPSYGIRIWEDNRYYLIGVNHNTNEIVVLDITAYDETGQAINPGIAEESEIIRVFNAVISGTKEGMESTIRFSPDIFKWILLGFGVYVAVSLVEQYYLSKQKR